MVLWLKPWESRSLPGLPRTRNHPLSITEYKTPLRETEAAFLFVRVIAAQAASFRHDPRSACEAREPAGSLPGAALISRALIQLNAIAREFMGHSRRGR